MSNKSNGGKRRITLSEKEIKLRFFWSLILFSTVESTTTRISFETFWCCMHLCCKRMTTEERVFFTKYQK